MPAEVPLDVPEPSEYPDVEEEERHEGHDPRRYRPDPGHVHDDVRPVQPQAEIGNHARSGGVRLRKFVVGLGNFVLQVCSLTVTSFFGQGKSVIVSECYSSWLFLV